jgi:hypothetical protein
MTNRKAGQLILFGIILYVLFPIVAGLLAIGDRDGPKIYPKTYHTALYMISYEALRNEKPRENSLYERPWFYGFPRKQREIKDDRLNGMLHDGP